MKGIKKKIMLKFSIIVPIYNVEKYVEKSIQSVLEQNYENFELILVNDGSKDNSKEICEKYAEIDSRIIVINKKNGGLPAARNSGIRKASGDYICHLDGDDFWKVGYLAYLNDILKKNQVDVLFGCGRYDYFGGDNYNKEYYYNISPNFANKDDLMEYLMEYNHEIPASACTNVYRTSFVKENELYFTEGLTWSEDTDNYFNVLLNCHSYGFMDEIYYVYRKNNVGAMTKEYSYNNIFSNIFVLRKWFEIYNESHINKDIKRISNIRFANTYIYVSLFAINTNEIDKNRLCDAMKEDFKIMKYSKGTKYRIIYYLYRLFGIKKSLNVLSLIRKQ